VFLTFENDDWEKELAAFKPTDVEVPAKLIVDGQQYKEVGVSFRGASSFFSIPEGLKRSLNISMDYLDSGQRLHGFKTLNLLNCNGDASLMSTVLYSSITGSKIPTPRANFVNVVINGESWGVYCNVEQFNGDFVQANYGTKQGARWKVHGSPRGDGGLRYLGEEIAPYRERFEIKSKDDDQSWRDLIALCKLLNETPADQLEEKLNGVLDIDGALWFLAADVALINSDGYWTRASDYNIYRDPAGVFHILPHDMNESFRPTRGGRGPGGPGGGGPGGAGPGGAGFGPGGPGFGPEGPRFGPPQDVGGPNSSRPGQRGRGVAPDQRGAGGFQPRDERQQPNGQPEGERFDRGQRGDFSNPGGQRQGPTRDAQQRGQDQDRPDQDRQGQGGPGQGGPGQGGPGQGGPGRGGPGFGESNGGGYALDPLIGLEDGSKPLRSKLLANPKLRERYLQYVREIAQSLDWGEFGPQVAQAKHLIEESVKLDTRKLMSTQAFLEATADKAGTQTATPMLRTFADERSKYLLNHDAIKNLPTEPVLVAASSSPFRAIVPVDQFSPLESTVMINEVMSSNASASKDSGGAAADWIELKNEGSQAVSLGGMYLTDDLGHARKWKFPEGATIDPGGYLLIWADGAKKKDDALHANFKLSKEGESLALVSDQGVIATLSFPALSENQSYGRAGGELKVLKPSPGKPNEG